MKLIVKDRTFDISRITKAIASYKVSQHFELLVLKKPFKSTFTPNSYLTISQ